MGKKNLKAGWNLCPCPFLLFVMREKYQIGRIDLNNQVKFYYQLQSFILLLSDEAICHHLVWGQIGGLGEQKKGRFSSLRSLLRPMYRKQSQKIVTDLRSLCAVLLDK